jgi:nitric oxide reductase subunit B
MRTSNRPAFYWIMAEAFGNFIGAGVWGFMMTLPQINLFSHGTQWTASHGHFAFWGAYASGVITVLYVARRKLGGGWNPDGRAWKWGFGLLNLGMIGMVSGLLVAGIAQAFYGRAIGGSTLMGFMAAQQNPWFVSGMYARFGFGLIFAAGYLVLIYSLLPYRAQAAETLTEARAA